VVIVENGQIVRSKLASEFTGNLYTTPQSAPLARLTDDEIKTIRANITYISSTEFNNDRYFAHAIMAAMQAKAQPAPNFAELEQEVARLRWALESAKNIANESRVLGRVTVGYKPLHEIHCKRLYEMLEAALAKHGAA
jgi:hypothetical protein